MKKLIPVALTCACAALPAFAEGNAVTLYGGYRGGGSFTDNTSSTDLALSSAAAGSMSIDVKLDSSRQWQLFLSQQNVDMSVPASAAPTSGGSTMPMTISYVHFGGTNFFEGPIGRGAYVMGGLGATFLALKSPGYGNEVYPSLNIGLGYQVPLAKFLALKLEGRMYSTLIPGNGNLFCTNGGCALAIQGNVLVQGELMLGLSATF